MNQPQETSIPPLEVDMDQTDAGFAEEVSARPGGRHIRRCYACGACSARCPVEDLDPCFDPRRTIRRVLLGLREEVFKNAGVWRCATCFTCQETCPQGVDFTEIMFVLKNMAVEAGYGPPGLGAQSDLLKAHGRLYEIGEFENKKRQELGLPELTERPEHFQVLLENFMSTSREDR